MTNGNSSEASSPSSADRASSGRHVVRALARRGYRIRVACRRPDLAGHLQPLGMPGQIMPVQANVRFPASLLAAVCGDAPAVINMAGVLYSAGAQTFDAMHVFGAEASAKAPRGRRARACSSRCRRSVPIASRPRICALEGRGRGACPGAFPGCHRHPSLHRLRTRGRVLQPLRRDGRFSPVMPLIGGGDDEFPAGFCRRHRARHRPDWSMRAIAGGQTYELGGPEALTFRALMEFVLKTIGRTPSSRPRAVGYRRIHGLRSWACCPTAAHRGPGRAPEVGQRR